jgi:hypothetical protein
MDVLSLGLVSFVCGGLVGAGVMALRAPEPVVIEVPVVVPPPPEPDPPPVDIPAPRDTFHTCVLLDNGKRVVGVLQRPDVPRELVKYHGRQPSETFRSVGEDGEGRHLFALVIHGID